MQLFQSGSGQFQCTEGIATVLVLDANICLALSNFAREKQDPNKESMSREFLLAVDAAKVDVLAYFGCLELASIGAKPWNAKSH